jgi:hypothetical protein
MNDLKIPKAYDEDKKGLLRIRAVSNDGQEDSLRRILEMKHVISNQLTKMNQDYIWRLIMEESHQSIIAYKVYVLPESLAFFCKRCSPCPFFKWCMSGE